MPDEDVSVEEQEGVDTEQQGAEEPSEEPTEELSEEEQLQAKLKEAIEVEAEDIGTLRKKLTVTVPRALIDERLQNQFAELKREAQVHGFRRGRAPLRLIEKRFGRDVGEEMTGPLLGNAFLAAIEKEDLKDKTIGDPRVWVQVPEHGRDESGNKETVLADKLLEIDRAIQHMHLPAEGPLTFSCEVELRPEFELPELKDISVIRPTGEVTDETVTAELERLRAMRGQYVPVEKGEIKADDLVVADVKGTVGDKVLIEEVNLTLAARDQRLAGISVEGLGKALVGKQAEAQVTVEAVVPDDYEDGDLRGQTAKFELTVHDIKRLKLPEIDEAFLSGLGADSEDELREMIKADAEANMKQMVQHQMRSDVRAYLLDKTELEIPEGLSQRQTDRAIDRRMTELYRMGVPQPEIEKRIDQLKASAAEEAVGDLKYFFIMEKIADELEVEVSEEELNSAIAGIAQRRGGRFDRVRDELSKGGGIENLYVQIRDDKILDRLVGDAKVSDAPAERPKKTKTKTK